MKPYKLTEDEYVAGYKLYAQQTTKQKLVLSAFMVILAVVSAVTSARHDFVTDMPMDYVYEHKIKIFALQFCVTFIVMCVVYALIKMTFSKYVGFKLRRSFYEDVTLSSEVSPTWTESDLTSTSALGTFKMPWPSIKYLRENETFVLLYLSRLRYLIIPKRAFDSDAEMAEFMSHLSTCPRI